MKILVLNRTNVSPRLLIPLLSTLLMCGVSAGHAAPAATAFTYQGLLTSGDNPANGLYEISFALYDAPTNGNLVGVPMTVAPLPVSNGLFIATLDFGAAVFNGADRWLEIAVTVFGSDQPVRLLAPRQPITPTPYALHAQNAAGLMSFANAPLDIKVNGQRVLRLEATARGPNIIGGASSNAVAPGVSGATIAGGGGAYEDDGLLEFLFNTVTADFGTVAGGLGNSVGGRYGAIGGGIGNTIKPIGAASTIGGGSENTVETDVPSGTIAGGLANTIGSRSSAATIGGGGINTIGSQANLSTIAGGYANRIGSNLFSATISGGTGNTIGNIAGAAVVAGGENNTIEDAASVATISGGGGNLIGDDADGSAIGGGEINRIFQVATYATIAGGLENRIFDHARHSVIGGGVSNNIASTSDSAAISGGSGNIVGSDSSFSTIGGGERNTIANEAWNSTIGGGEINLIDTQTDGGTIAGGAYNAIGGSADNAVIGGGTLNTNKARAGTIAGGSANQITSLDSESATIGGGSLNLIRFNAVNATIAGGLANQALAPHATVGGGIFNTNYGYAATVAGGFHNASGAPYAFTGGGTFNDSYGEGSTVAGGGRNMATGGYSTVGGGYGNLSRGNSSTVPGGTYNFADGTFSFAAGHYARALHPGAFTWSDFSETITHVPLPFASQATNEFSARATGGVRFVTGIETNGDATAGVSLAPGSGTWSSLSDRNAKENFIPTDPREILEKVAALSVASWNYKAQGATVRHVGPTAQDFHAAFGLGESDRTITTVDADGVALAAIQGLNRKLQEREAALREELQRRDAENADLKARLTALEKLITAQRP